MAGQIFLTSLINSPTRRIELILSYLIKASFVKAITKIKDISRTYYMKSEKLRRNKRITLCCIYVIRCWYAIQTCINKFWRRSIQSFLLPIRFCVHHCRCALGRITNLCFLFQAHLQCSLLVKEHGAPCNWWWDYEVHRCTNHLWFTIVISNFKKKFKNIIKNILKINCHW